MSENQNKDNEKNSLCNVWWFLGLTVFCSLITWYFMQKANTRLETTHAIIINHQTKSIEGLDSLISLYRNMQKDSVSKTSNDCLEQLYNQLIKIAKNSEEIYSSERISNLLESELAKIQSEYEVLNLWCALLTVVFLIFSFFSIFKANEMANQSEDALKSMRTIERDVQTKSESIDEKIKEANRKIENLTNSITGIETRQKELSNIVENFGNNEIKEIQNHVNRFMTLKKEIDDLNNTAKEDIQNLTINLKKELEDKAESSINNNKATIIDTVKLYFDKNAETFNSKIDGLTKSIDKIYRDFQDFAKDDIDKVALAAEAAEEENDTDLDEYESIEDYNNDNSGDQPLNA